MPLSSTRIKTHHLFLFFALVWGIVQLLIMPPFQVPDEPGHFLRAWGVSDGQFVNHELNVRIPENVIKLWKDTEIIDVRNGKCCFKKLLTHLNDKIDSKETIVAVAFCAYNPIGYIPQSIGINIAKKFNLSPLYAFYFGRFFNLLVGAILIFYAIKYVPFGKDIFLFTALFPMTIHQLASFSNDALTLSGLMFLTSQIIYFSQKTTLNTKNLIYLLILSIIFIQVKPGYVAFILLFLILTYRQFPSKKIYLLFLFLVLISNLMLFYIMSNLVDIDKYIKLIPQIRPKEQIDFILKNPFEYISIFLNTLNKDPWLTFRSMIGILGWLTMSFPKIFYLFIIISFIIILLCNNEKVYLNNYQRFIFFLIFSLTLFIILTLQYIFWTEPNSHFIEGFQGRYVISTFPLIIISFYKIKLSPIEIMYKKWNDSYKRLALIIIFSVISITSIIFIYSHYINYYSNNCLANLN